MLKIIGLFLELLCLYKQYLKFYRDSQKRVYHKIADIYNIQKI